MKIEIWSDIACPWCYIGRRRLEHALDEFEHRDQVEIVWRSFQLDPSAPKEYPGTLNDMLVDLKGISHQQAEMMHKRVTDLAALEGLDYHMDIARAGNSFDAHRLIHLAAHHGLQGEMKESIQKAYFTEGQSFSDHHTLVKLATEVGLDADEVRAMLKGNDYADAVRADIRKAQMIGINGVPFFVFENKYGISGAQPSETFTLALERTWNEFHPLIEVVNAGNSTDSAEAGACTDDTCAV